MALHWNARLLFHGILVGNLQEFSAPVNLIITQIQFPQTAIPQSLSDWNFIEMLLDDGFLKQSCIDWWLCLLWLGIWNRRLRGLMPGSQLQSVTYNSCRSLFLNWDRFGRNRNGWRFSAIISSDWHACRSQPLIYVYSLDNIRFCYRKGRYWLKYVRECGVDR